MVIMGPAIFPYDFPTFVVLPVVRIVAYVVSVTDSSDSAKKERAAFDFRKIRRETGLGAVNALAH